jgi:lipoate-protein ligase A
MSECWGFLKDGFIKVFDVERVEGQLSREERQLALKLEKEKCSTADWIFKRIKLIPSFYATSSSE